MLNDSPDFTLKRQLLLIEIILGPLLGTTCIDMLHAVSNSLVK